MKENAVFHKANAGFSYDYQLVDVPDYNGRGESAPSPWFYQNEGEAEYIVSVYMYMRLLGYPTTHTHTLFPRNMPKKNKVCVCRGRRDGSVETRF